MEFYLKLFWNVLSDRERMGVSAQSDPVRRMAALHRWLAGRFQRAALQRGLANYCRVGVGDSLRVAPLELKEWLAMEIDVTSDRDILQWSERGAYLHWVIQNDYAGDGQHSDVTQVFPAIVEAVVRHALSRPLSA